MIHNGDVREILPTIPDASVDCIITSPPYFQLRDYGGLSAQIGNEETYQEYLSNLTSVFAECKRILKDDGTMWINIGDKYDNGCLLMLPARLAILLSEAGWFIRNEIIWDKPNAMPNGGQPVKLDCSHETIYLLTKSSSDYYFNLDAVKVKSITADRDFGYSRGCNVKGHGDDETGGRIHMFGGHKYPGEVNNRRYSGNQYVSSEYRRLRDVWRICTQPYAGAHFACYPEELVRRCILAGCKQGGVVMDIFSGSGTTGKVAYDLGRQYIGIELNPEYVELSKKRIGSTMQTSLMGGA